jgi:hypothetical protein
MMPLRFCAYAFNVDGGYSSHSHGLCMKHGSCIIKRGYLYIYVRNHIMRRGQSEDNPLEPLTCISLHGPTNSPRYFKNLVLDFCRSRSESVSFNILPSNTLNPEIIDINPPAKKTVIVLANSFFTKLVCHESLGSLCTEDSVVPEITDLETYVRSLDWLHYMKYLCMKTMAMMGFWIESEVFKHVAKIS